MPQTLDSRAVILLLTSALLVALPHGAFARDLDDVLAEAGRQILISTGQVQSGILGPPEATNFDFGLTSFDDLSAISSNVVNDRVIPVSSSVSGFTFEYNQDLDVYERSTSTFGPLFTERAQTIGRGRLLVGLSATYMEFDEFDGNDLSGIEGLDIDPDLSVSLTDTGILAFEPGSTDDLDLYYDIDMKQSIAALQLSYGISDRLDIGIVVPMLHIDFDASARPIQRGGAPLVTCAAAGLDQKPCDLQSGTKVSEDHTGIGDLIVRSKWHFLRGSGLDAAAVLSATIPTGSPENLTGFHTMTFKPGLVVSRDLVTDMGGLSFHAFAGWDIRPDEGKAEEIEWAAGVAYQPYRRTSLSVDILGSHKTHDVDFGGDRIDASIGTKIMVAPGMLADFNVILPLNDDGLRSDAIFSAQFEYTFGD